MKDIHFLISRHLLEKQGQLKLSLETEALVHANFAFCAFPVAQVGKLWCSRYYPAALLKPESPGGCSAPLQPGWHRGE